MIELFSIPIYTCSPEEFKIRYDEFINSRCKGVIETCKDVGADPNKYIEREKERHPNLDRWLYNQIVGYIRIIYVERSIYYFIFEPQDKQIRTFSSKKHLIAGRMMNDYCFSIKKDQDSLAKMNENLNQVISFLPKKYYVDLEQYNTISKHIDFNKLFEIDSRWY